MPCLRMLEHTLVTVDAQPDAWPPPGTILATPYRTPTCLQAYFDGLLDKLLQLLLSLLNLFSC